MLLCNPVGWWTWCGQLMWVLCEGQMSQRPVLRVDLGSWERGGVAFAKKGKLGRHSVICSFSWHFSFEHLLHTRHGRWRRYSDKWVLVSRQDSRNFRSQGKDREVNRDLQFIMEWHLTQPGVGGGGGGRTQWKAFWRRGIQSRILKDK